MKSISVPAKRPRSASPSAQSRDTVQSLSRALSLLNALAARENGLGLSELAKTTGLAVSTTHRLLTTLQQDGFVRYDAERSAWMIGVQSFIVGSAFLRSRDLAMIARPVMRQLMEKSGETVNLAVEDRGEAVYIAQVECRKMMRAIARPGGRAMMHSSAVGKALLAAMEPEDVARILKTHGLPRETAKTIGTAASLRSNLKEITSRGYAIDDEENAIGLRCLAAVVRDEQTQPVAALSLSGPTARIGDSLLEPLGAAVKQAADKMTDAFGGRRV